MTKRNCGIYEISSSNGRESYKIFSDPKELEDYLDNNKGKKCKQMEPIYQSVPDYRETATFQIRQLTSNEVEIYLHEQKNSRNPL